MNVAILESTWAFEDFYLNRLGMGYDEFVQRWRGGWTWSYCRMLRLAGITPHVYIPSLTRTGAHPTPDGYQVRFISLGRSYRTWNRVALFKRSVYGRYITGLFNGVSLIHELERGAQTDGIDVLALQEYWPSRYDVLSHRLTLPFVAIDQGHSSEGELTFAKRRVLPRAARIITQTEYEARRVRSLGARAERIPNGVDAQFWRHDREREPPEERLVVSVARLDDSQKRISDLLRAVALLGDQWRLSVAGRGRDSDMLQSLARELGIASRVDFVGFLHDRARIRSLIRRGSVFALPSAREGLPLALLEAMSTGTPVVCTDIPAMTEVVTNGVDGLVVPVGRPHELAAAIASACDRRAELSASARAAIEREYTEERIGQRLAQLLRAVTCERPGNSGSPVV